MPEQQFEDLNSGFIQELFEQYLRAPESVDPAWRALFEHTPEKLESSPVVQRVRELYPGAANGGNGAPAVVEADTVIGLVSIGDVVKALLHEQQFFINQLERYITA